MESDRRSEDIRKAFGERTYQRGMAYFEDGKVIDLIVDGDSIMGQVIGRGDRPYDVSLVWNDRITSSCSCPVEDMCKHGAALALAFISGDAERVDLERAKSEIECLDEKEAKGLLMDCMALEPNLALLLPKRDGRHRVDDVLKHLDRSLSDESKFGIPVPLYDEVDLAVRIARRWQGEGADEDRLRLILEILERLLEHPGDWYDSSHRAHSRATRMLTEILGNSLSSVSEKDLEILFDKLLELNRRDEFDIGVYDMLEVMAARRGVTLDPDAIFQDPED